MATDQATESLPDQLSSLPRVDDTAYLLRTSVDVLCGILRSHGIDVNTGDRVPLPVVLEVLQDELDLGRAWPVMVMERVR
jgi:hypothetical protein